MDDPDLGGVTVKPGEGEGDLETEELVEGEPTAGRCDLVEALGEVDRLDGRVPVDSPSRARISGGTGSERGRERVRALWSARRIHPGPALPPKPGCTGTMRPVRSPSTSPEQDIHVGSRHLHRPPIPLDLAGESHLGPRRKLALPERLVEPDRLEHPGPVAKTGLDDDEAASGTPGGD